MAKIKTTHNTNCWQECGTIERLFCIQYLSSLKKVIHVTLDLHLYNWNSNINCLICKHSPDAMCKWCVYCPNFWLSLETQFGTNEKQGNGHLVLLGSNSMHEHHDPAFCEKGRIWQGNNLSFLFTKCFTIPIFPTIQISNSTIFKLLWICFAFALNIHQMIWRRIFLGFGQCLLWR